MDAIDRTTSCFHNSSKQTRFPFLAKTASGKRASLSNGMATFGTLKCPNLDPILGSVLEPSWGRFGSHSGVDLGVLLGSILLPAGGRFCIVPTRPQGPSKNNTRSQRKNTPRSQDRNNPPCQRKNNVSTPPPRRTHVPRRTHDAPERFQEPPKLAEAAHLLTQFWTHRRCEMIACANRGIHLRWELLLKILLETSRPKTPLIHTQMAPRRPQTLSICRHWFPQLWDAS